MRTYSQEKSLACADLGDVGVILIHSIQIIPAQQLYTRNSTQLSGSTSRVTQTVDKRVYTLLLKFPSTLAIIMRMMGGDCLSVLNLTRRMIAIANNLVRGV